jgi:Flp pilus assembly protein TadG
MLKLSSEDDGGQYASANAGGRRGRLAGDCGQALLETAITLPLVLFVAVGIFEFGRAYQTAHVINNAVREGARLAILPNTKPEDVQARVSDYLRGGYLANAGSASVSVNQNATMSIGTSTAGASVVTVSYPFSFIVLNPVANLVVRGSTLGNAPFSMTASAQMRNEAQ